MTADAHKKAAAFRRRPHIDAALTNDMHFVAVTRLRFVFFLDRLILHVTSDR